jgi:hypothetical protein
MTVVPQSWRFARLVIQKELGSGLPFCDSQLQHASTGPWDAMLRLPVITSTQIVQIETTKPE